jgi:hypothetical protein
MAVGWAGEGADVHGKTESGQMERDRQDGRL